MFNKIQEHINNREGDKIISLTENKKYNEYNNNWNYIADCENSSYKIYVDDDGSINSRWI